MNLSQADELYRLAEDSDAFAVLVADPTVERFDRISSEIKARVADDSVYASDVVRTVRRLRWDLSSVPIYRSGELLGLSSRIRALAQMAAPSAEILGREVATLLQLAITSLREVESSGPSPLADEVVKLLQDERSAVLLIRDVRMRASVQAWLETTGVEVTVVTPVELNHLTPVDRIVVCGPFRWYPPPLLLAPRAPEVAFVYHDWIRDVAGATGLLDTPSSGVSRTIRLPVIGPRLTPRIDAGDLVPEIDWDRLADAASGHVTVEHEMVPARLLLLADDTTVFLEAEEGPSVFTVDPDGDAGHRVRRVQANRIGPGDYLLLRTARGAEDVIRAVADDLLGRDAPALRGLQTDWKYALAQRVKDIGPAAATRRLRGMGIQANNLRYWLSPDSIRTARPLDFKILMDFAGLLDRATELWRAMERIDDAHREAGQQIRSLLEDEVERASTEVLRQTGHLDVRLGRSHAGALTIYRVEAKAPTLMSVPQSSLRLPQRISPDRWLG